MLKRQGRWTIKALLACGKNTRSLSQFAFLSLRWQSGKSCFTARRFFHLIGHHCYCMFVLQRRSNVEGEYHLVLGRVRQCFCFWGDFQLTWIRPIWPQTHGEEQGMRHVDDFRIFPYKKYHFLLTHQPAEFFCFFFHRFFSYIQFVMLVTPCYCTYKSVFCL